MRLRSYAAMQLTLTLTLQGYAAMWLQSYVAVEVCVAKE